MDEQYLATAQEINKELKQYQKELENLVRFSSTAPLDIVKYVLDKIRNGHSLEITRIMIQVLLANHVPLNDLLKIIIKVLYLLKTTLRHSHGDFYIVKQFIDSALEGSSATAAKLARKKYELILQTILDSDSKLEKQQQENLQSDRFVKKAEAIDNLRDNINRQYIKFI